MFNEQRIIQEAFSHGDTAFFETLIAQEVMYVGIVRQKPRIALDALALFFEVQKRAGLV